MSAGRHFPQSRRRLVIGIDDTIERRWGQKISTRGIYRDPVRSSKGHFVKTSGLRWLSAQLLVHYPGSAVSWACCSSPCLHRPSARRTSRAHPRHCWTGLVRLHTCRSTAGCRAGALSSSATPRVRRGRFPWCRPKLCQRRHPIAPRRQTCAPAPPSTTVPRTTGGQGQAPAHTRRKCCTMPARFGNATPSRLVHGRNQSCRWRSPQYRRLGTVAARPRADLLSSGARSAQRITATGLPLHRFDAPPSSISSSGSSRAAVGGYLPGGPCPSRRRNPTSVVRSGDHAHHPGAARPVLAGCSLFTRPRADTRLVPATAAWGTKATLHIQRCHWPPCGREIWAPSGFSGVPGKP